MYITLSFYRDGLVFVPMSIFPSYTLGQQGNICNGKGMVRSLVQVERAASVGSGGGEEGDHGLG